MGRTTPHDGSGWVGLAGGLVSLLVLAACSAASPASSASSMPPMSMGIESIEPSVSIAGSPSGPLRCAVTPDATASATIEITTDELGFYHFGAPVSIEAGQAVAFNNGNAAPHTITEGTYGVAVDDPCVNEPLAQNASVTVTFYEVGEYPITCRPHPVMQTAVTVQ